MISLALPPADKAGATLMQRAETLATFSEQSDGLTRRSFTREHRAALDQLEAWMQAAGMTTRLDPLGTLIGRIEGTDPAAPAVMMGSHHDSVRDAGKYDGPLGILAPLGAIEALHASGQRLSCPVELVVFADEEGVRFGTSLFGSRGLAGTFDPGTLEVADRDGVTLRRALSDFGLDPEAAASAARQPGEVGAFVETHIEQGPVLEAEDRPLGVVTGIAGAWRLRAQVSGEAGHAGTVPMAARRDALAGAAAMVLAIEALAQDDGEGLVATVGAIEAAPGAINVIPGGASFTIDLRAPTNAHRDHALETLEGRLRAIAEQRGLAVALRRDYETAAVAMDEGVIARLERAIERTGLSARRLFSGAGHDAMAMTALCPAAMLFVRCAGGISHNPAESITANDAGHAVRANLQFLLDWGAGRERG